MKKAISLFLSLVILLSVTAGLDLSAYAAAPSINATNVELYFLDDSYAKVITQPSSCKKSFQLKVTGADVVSYRVQSGNGVKVSSSGLIELVVTTYYWYGNMGTSFPMEGQTPTEITHEYEPGDNVISVTAGSTTFKVNVKVCDYADVYCDKVMNDYISNNVKPGMTDRERVELAAKFAADYEYSASYSSARSMIIFGGGDCWASTDAVIKVAKKMGFDAWSRNGNRDPGAGSGHMNAMVQVTDGTVYEVEAGYYEPAPRGYYVRERSTLFSYKYSSDGLQVYQYDGKTTPDTLVIPESINGYPVVLIGEKFISLNSNVKQVVLPDTIKSIGKSAFNTCEALESINLPSSLTQIGEFAFTKCNKLTNITNSSSAFTVENGVIYNKDKTQLICAPSSASVNIPSTVSTINEYAFYHNYNLKSITVPSNIKALQQGVFGNCEALTDVTINNGLETVYEYAFAYCTKLTRLVFPSSVNHIYEYACYYANKLSQVTVLNKECVIGDSKYTFPESAVLYGYSGSTLESYAAKYNRTFVSIDNCKHTSTTETIIQQPTCTQTGLKDIQCNICSAVVKTNVTIPTVPHTEVVDVPARQATCTQNGNTKGSHCDVCKNVLSVSETIYSQGHNYGWRASGNSVVYSCDKCNSVDKKLPFTDITAYAGYGNYLLYTSVDNKFINGTNPPEFTQFSPTTAITRAMFVTILYRMAGSPYDEANPFESSPFTDITNTSVYYYNAACWALDNGITTQTTFKPNDLVVREQTASFLFRYANGEGFVDSSYEAVNLQAYPDYSDVSSWAVPAMQWANQQGMITGTQQGTLNPKGSTLRIHATKILYGFGCTCAIGNGLPN